MSQILGKARKTFESARKNAYDSYLRHMTSNSFRTLENFEHCHSHSWRNALEHVNEIEISGADDIKEMHLSILINVIINLTIIAIKQ